MAKELNETFPGIEAVNDFYTPYYMKEYFPDEVKNASTPWKQLPPEERPARLLKDAGGESSQRRGIARPDFREVCSCLLSGQ